MGADSSDDQKQSTFVPTDLVVVPASGGPRESVADFTYSSPNGWTARGRLGSGPGGLYLQTITVEANPGQRVTANTLRELPLREILASAQRTDFVIEAGLALVSETLPPAEASGTKGPGRTPLSDDLLREVALGYLDQTAPGMGRGAVKRLAERMGVDTKTMSRYVFRARQSGWLGPAIQGREGSEPGPRLLEELPQGRLTARMARSALSMNPEEAAEFMREAPASSPPEE